MPAGIIFICLVLLVTLNKTGKINGVAIPVHIQPVQIRIKGKPSMAFKTAAIIQGQPNPRREEGCRVSLGKVESTHEGGNDDQS